MPQTTTNAKLVLVQPRPRHVRRLYLGRTGGPEMQTRAMELFPIPNDEGRMVMAEKWIEAVRYLRKRKKWLRDRMVQRKA